MKTLFTLFCLLFSLSLQAAQVTVSTPKWWSKADTTSIGFNLSKRVRYSIFTLEKPHRLVIDFRNSRYTGKASQKISGHPLIRKIRSGSRKNGTYRVVLDLHSKITPNSFISRNGKRLIVEMKGKGRTPVVTRQARISKPVSRKSPVQVTKKVTKKARPADKVAQIQYQKKPVSRFSGRDVVVIIDAGHGGKDVGAQGKNGTLEKEVVLGIARQLAKQINREEGMRAVLTRSGDYFVKLRDRMQIARDANADLFISVHANGYKNALAKGASVYILSSQGASSEAARLLAEQENKAASIGSIELANKDDDLKAVLIDLSQSATIEESYDVASKVLKSLRSLGRIHLSKVQKAGFAVLKSPDVPSILIETAFITNPAEERKLRSSIHQLDFATAILNGTRDYFYANPPPGTLIAAKVQRPRTFAKIRSSSIATPDS